VANSHRDQTPYSFPGEILDSGVIKGDYVIILQPEYVAGDLSFTDMDLSPNQISGTVSITKARDESTVTHYVPYWGQDGFAKLNWIPIEILPITGADPAYEFALNTEIPAWATHFLVFTENEGSELSTPVYLAKNDVDCWFENP